MLENSARHNAPQVSPRKLSRGMDLTEKAIRDWCLVFVFGSNLAGQHGAGAVAHAESQWGAVRGQGEGLHGQSYAIPTKTAAFHTMPIRLIMTHLETFKEFASARLDLKFKVTRIGCGISGFDDLDIAPLFIGAPDNCLFDTSWYQTIGDRCDYWGHVA